jgi:hypothetical protein
MDDFTTLTFREPGLLKKASSSTTYPIGKELMLRGRRDWR